MTTKLIYMDDFDVVTCSARVASIIEVEDGRTDIQLDQTCFYPRGGGQDWDTGTISGPHGTLHVDEVRLDELGIAHHVGKIDGTIKVNDEVTCKVDEKRRGDNTRLHSAGHVIDMAVDTLELGWVPGRGAHYPHMSFVEYEAMNENPDIATDIERTANAIIASGLTNTLRYMSKDELAAVCRHVPTNLPSNKPTRVVLYGDFGVPCGGTHVRQLADIGTIGVTKVKSKKGLTKVSYTVEGIN